MIVTSTNAMPFFALGTLPIYVSAQLLVTYRERDREGKKTELKTELCNVQVFARKG